MSILKTNIRSFFSAHTARLPHHLETCTTARCCHTKTTTGMFTRNSAEALGHATLRVTLNNRDWSRTTLSFRFLGQMLIWSKWLMLVTSECTVDHAVVAAREAVSRMTTAVANTPQANAPSATIVSTKTSMSCGLRITGMWTGMWGPR